VAILYQAILREGSIVRAAALWRTSPACLYKLLDGELPRLDAVKRILAGAKLSADQLMGGKEPKKENKLTLLSPAEDRNANTH